EEKFGDNKKQTSMREDYTILKKAFKKELSKPGEDYVDAFLNHLDGCAKVWRPNKFYSPYTSLVQASGTGKSRLLRELATEKDVLVIYICLRKSGWHGYPNRSTIADYLTKEAHDETYYMGFLSALFRVCKEFLEQLKIQYSGKICGHMFDILISDSNDTEL
ncbi:1350_t:CDS:1, partial [Diversispora eburnea]